MNQKKKIPPLQKLILLQDWQRVLCRVQLYPDEIKEYSKFQVDDKVQLKILPIHLICALDPPLAVVEYFLSAFPDSVALPVRPIKASSIYHLMTDEPSSSSRGWKGRYQEWRRNRRGAFPVVVETRESFAYAQESLLPTTSSKAQSVYVTAVQSEAKLAFTDNHDNDSEHSSSISSRPSSTDNDKNILLQLTPSGGLQPIPVHAVTTDETDSGTTALYRVHWDLQPIQEHVVTYGNLLPLHIACFYTASTPVLRVIANAYPAATLCNVVGMLPIHWVAAGWILPPLVPPLTLPIPPPPKSSPLETLTVLKEALPDSIRVRSGNHGMTPEEYIQECMEESDQKDSCVRLLLQDDSSSEDSIIFSASYDTSSEPSPQKSDFVACLSTLFQEHNWKGILQAVETDPSIAGRWIYGVDDNTVRAVLWKRLPIHLACFYNAPVGLVTVLLESFPDGVSQADPLDGSTPLHILCKSSLASPTLIRLLFGTGVEIARAVNCAGQIPLHVAILSHVSYHVIEALVEEDPMSVSVVDAEGLSSMDHAKRIYGESSVVHELMTMIHLFLNKPKHSMKK